MNEAPRGHGSGPSKHALEVLLAEDDDRIAHSVARAIEPHAIARHVRGVKDGVQVAREMGAALHAAIIDVGLLDGSGIALALALREKHPHLPILVITGQDGRELANAAQLAGAHFAYKPIDARDIDAFLLRAGAENADARIDATIEALREEAALSDRETEIVRLAVAGTLREQLAAQQNVKESTIKTQVRSLLTKTGAVSLDAIVRRVLRTALTR